MTLTASTPQVFYRMLQNYKETQLLLAGIRLDVFSHLHNYLSPEEIAVTTGYNERNLNLFLNSLASIDLLDKQNGKYKNKAAADLYLNRQSELYLGEYLLFREAMTGLGHVVERVKNGPVPKVIVSNDPLLVYDFYTLARLSATEMYTGRIQSFLEGIGHLFAYDDCIKALDLGGGSGVLSIELVKTYPNAAGVVFEHPLVAKVPEEMINAAGLESRLKVTAGDFLTDDIGEFYDIVIASGILDFAKENLAATALKIYQAVKPGGYLYLVSNKVSEDYQSPKESIVGWLSGQLDGLNVLLSKASIDSALESTGLKLLKQNWIDGIIDSLQGEFYVKTPNLE